MRFNQTLIVALAMTYAVLSCVDVGMAQNENSMKVTMDAVGKVDFPISCSSEAQSRFERGLALLHHMMYGQAEEEFVAVAEMDSDCAMAHWGIAMTLFHPLWAPPSVDHPTRLTAWEAAQEKVHKANPDDIDAAAFYALAHISTAPKADKTFTHQKEAGALLEALRTKAPEHPGLFHYIIHAYDNPMLASRALEVARGYDKIAPEVPHALHMPTHIFVRLGLWPEAIDWNVRSAAAAKRQSVGGVVSLHYIHALDYLMYAYLQQCQNKMAQDVLHKINAVENYPASFASAYAIAAAQARYPLERAQWANAAALKVRTHSSFPWDKYPWFESITYFARGLGAARSGDIAAGRKAIETLDAFYERSVNAEQGYWAVHVDAQRKTVAAWIAFSEGKKDQALRMMREAADLEDSVDKHPVTPGAVLPARELFGDMLVMLEGSAEAIEAYEASLQISPNRFNSLYGAGRAAELAGNSEKAKSYYSKLVEFTAKADSDRPGIEQAKTFLSKN